VKRESVATGITVNIEELQRQHQDSFRIPEWFLYTSRAFLTLEGVSLQADPDYSIIKNCFPYVAKRLIVDDDPRAEKALKDVLYGAENAIDVKRIADLADGFSSYTAASKTLGSKSASSKEDNGKVVRKAPKVGRMSKEEARKQALDDMEAAMLMAKESADILLSQKGNLVQTLLVQEGALAASARFKDEVRKTFVEGPKKLRKKLPFGLFLPTLPFEKQLEPFVKKSTEEQHAQDLAQKLAHLGTAQPSVPGQNVGALPIANVTSVTDFVQKLRNLDPEQASLVLTELRSNLPKYAPLVTNLGAKFAQSLLATASANIEATLTELEKAGDRPGRAVRVTAKQLSNVAQFGATVLPTANKNNKKGGNNKNKLI